MSIVRRFRAAAIVSTAWALFWVPLGVALSVVLVSQTVREPLSWRDIQLLVTQGAVVSASWGVVSGLIFTAALAAAERGGQADALARGRIVTWGAVSGAALPLILGTATASMNGLAGLRVGPILTVIAIGALFGALVATVLLALARRPSPTN